METYCSFTKYPAPILALDDPGAPFPDIPASLFCDVGEVIELATKKLSASDRGLSRRSYLKIFRGEGDILQDSSEGIDAVCYSPQLAATIIAAADALSRDTLREAVSRSSKSEYFEAFESVDDFLQLLDEILEPFRKAPINGYGIIIAMA